MSQCNWRGLCTMYSPLDYMCRGRPSTRKTSCTICHEFIYNKRFKAQVEGIEPEDRRVVLAKMKYNPDGRL